MALAGMLPMFARLRVLTEYDACLPPTPCLLCLFCLLCLQWLLDVLQDPDMTDPDACAAFSTLLAAGATAAAAAAGQHQQQLVAAEHNLRQMFVQLQPSREQKLRLRGLLQQLAGLTAEHPAVQEFNSGFQVGS